MKREINELSARKNERNIEKEREKEDVLEEEG